MGLYRDKAFLTLSGRSFRRSSALTRQEIFVQVNSLAPDTSITGQVNLPFARMIGNATHLSPELPGRAGDRPQDQAASGVAWLGSQSKRHLHFFNELFPLRLRKTNDQPGEAR